MLAFLNIFVYSKEIWEKRRW